MEWAETVAKHKKGLSRLEKPSIRRLAPSNGLKQLQNPKRDRPAGKKTYPLPIQGQHVESCLSWGSMWNPAYPGAACGILPIQGHPVKSCLSRGILWNPAYPVASCAIMPIQGHPVESCLSRGILCNHAYPGASCAIMPILCSTEA
jgi:hypothetical protein